ncbi:MFS transporter, multidrug efflux [Blastocystis sp. subtype 1]
MGPISDRYGRKPMIIFSLIGSSVGAIAQGLSTNIWMLIITRSLTGLAAGSWIVAQAYIADCTTPDERPKYLARLEAFLAAAYIFGPAIGGFLGQIKLGLPFIAAGIVATIALVFVIIYLNESLDKEAAKKELEKKKNEPKTPLKEILSPIIVIPPSLPHLQVICMVVEFCNRWLINGWDSYYNTFAEHRWNMTSLQFSLGRFIAIIPRILVTCLGVFSCVLSAWLYPTLVFKLNTPIPVITGVAGALQIISNLIIAHSNTLGLSVVGSVLNEAGYTLSSPSPASIISSYSSSSIQGQVLSYNMMAGQCAMILAPAVMGQLSKVKDFVPFYTTVVGGSIVLLAMLFVLSRPGGSKAGRMTKEEWDKMKEEMAKKEVEMEEKKGEENEVDEVAVEMREEKPAEQEEMKEVEVKKEEVKEEVKPAEMKEEVVVTSQ